MLFLPKTCKSVLICMFALFKFCFTNALIANDWLAALSKLHKELDSRFLKNVTKL